MLEIGCSAMQIFVDLLQDKSVVYRVLSCFLVEQSSSAALINNHK